MHSLAAAARVLERCDSLDTCGELLRELGFSDLLPLGPEQQEALGLNSGYNRPRLAVGTGALRALVMVVDSFQDPRLAISLTAARLVSHAPHLLWVIVAISITSDTVGVAAVDNGPRRPRTAALISRRAGIVDSDCETLCALAAAGTHSDVVIHRRWVEILGRESVSRRFFRELERLIRNLAASQSPFVPPPDSSELALLYASRLLFLSFLETKGWLARDHGFLANRFADCMVSGGSFHRRVLLPLFFGTLNTRPADRARRARDFGSVPFLNGGLFARSHLERRHASARFSDESIGDLFGDLLSRYRFTAREDNSIWSEAAVDPEMLGKAFENLMSSAIRKTSGAFYTPQSLVARVSSHALAYRLASPTMPVESVRCVLDGEIPGPRERAALLESIACLRILDPACGSGAFLVHILEQLSATSIRLGDLRPPHRIRRALLTSSIFGVDINPTAVWLCELRLWLSMAIEDPEIDPMRVSALPNLDRNIRVGDSLSGATPHHRVQRSAAREAGKLRARYMRSSGPRKRALASALDAMERKIAIASLTARLSTLVAERREMLSAARARDLFGERHSPGAESRSRLIGMKKHIRQTRLEIHALEVGGALPFSFTSGFAEAASGEGFDVVLGNPPWVRTHHISATARVALSASFEVYRNAAWRAGSEAASAAKGFASQIDTSALFVERSAKLLKPGGVSALIVPAKLWKSLAGGGVREFLMRSADLRELHDLTRGPQGFDAAVYPSIVVAQNPGASREPSTFITQAITTLTVHERDRVVRWRARPEAVCFDASPGSPWLIVPEDVRASYERMRSAGIPFGKAGMGRPLLGVKTGFNDAFLVTEADESHRGDGCSVRVSNAARGGSVERGMLRPVIRGETVTPWRFSADRTRIIWTHDSAGRPLRLLPSGAMRWLSHTRRSLERRSDARGQSPWWKLFRTDGADPSRFRVVWADIGRAPRALVLEPGDRSVPLNTCYVVRCAHQEDALTLTALLNSEPIARWLAVIAEPARGAYHRYLAWTISMLPVPADWSRAKQLLCPLATLGLSGSPPDPASLTAAVLESYGIEPGSVEALLSWQV